jgi:hypothetical protein
MAAKHNSRATRIFLPWFLDLRTMRKVEAILPYYYHTRLRFYFDKCGCIRCNRKQISYCANGLCKPCTGLVSDRLERSDKTMKRRYGKRSEVPSAVILKRMMTAQELLADFRTAQPTRKMP